jgi:hypothetical protein
MIDPTGTSAPGIFKLLVGSLSKFGGKKAEVLSLKKLADRKFREIERTHSLFVKLLGDLERATTTAREKVNAGKSVGTVHASLRTALAAVEERRKKNLSERMSQYHEAEVFRELGFHELGILKKVPDDVTAQLITFMSVFTSYFESEVEHLYRHALGNSVEVTRTVLRRLEDAKKEKKPPPAKEKESAMEMLTSLKTEIEGFISFTANRWVAIASEYHKLGLLFRQHGYG